MYKKSVYGKIVIENLKKTAKLFYMNFHLKDGIGLEFIAC